MRPQIRRVDEHVERFAARRRGAGLGEGRRGEVARRVGRGLAFFVDEVELLVRVAAEDEVVMREVFVAFVQAEVEHDAGACGLVFAPALEGHAGGAARCSSRCVRTESQFDTTALSATLLAVVGAHAA